MQPPSSLPICADSSTAPKSQVAGCAQSSDSAAMIGTGGNHACGAASPRPLHSSGDDSMPKSGYFENLSQNAVPGNDGDSPQTEGPFLQPHGHRHPCRYGLCCRGLASAEHCNSYSHPGDPDYDAVRPGYDASSSHDFDEVAHALIEVPRPPKPQDPLCHICRRRAIGSCNHCHQLTCADCIGWQWNTGFLCEVCEDRYRDIFDADDDAPAYGRCTSLVAPGAPSIAPPDPSGAVCGPIVEIPDPDAGRCHFCKRVAIGFCHYCAVPTCADCTGWRDYGFTCNSCDPILSVRHAFAHGTTLAQLPCEYCPMPAVFQCGQDATPLCGSHALACGTCRRGPYCRICVIPLNHTCIPDRPAP